MSQDKANEPSKSSETSREPATPKKDLIDIRHFFACPSAPEYADIRADIAAYIDELDRQDAQKVKRLIEERNRTQSKNFER